MNSIHMQQLALKLNSVFDILQIHCWKLVLTFPSVPDHINMNRLNQINVFMYTYPYLNNEFFM